MSERKPLKAKRCYGHLGGTLGNRLFERMLEMNWLTREEGKSTVYVLTETGKEAFEQLGVDIYERR